MIVLFHEDDLFRISVPTLLLILLYFLIKSNQFKLIKSFLSSFSNFPKKRRNSPNLLKHSVGSDQFLLIPSTDPIDTITPLADMAETGGPLAQAFALLSLSEDGSHTVAEVVKAYR